MSAYYLVTLAEPSTGKDQRILVETDNPDGMQEFVSRVVIHNPRITITDPQVISVRRLRIKRPVQRTAWPTVVKSA